MVAAFFRGELILQGRRWTFTFFGSFSDEVSAVNTSIDPKNCDKAKTKSLWCEKTTLPELIE
jgi:hypothetical protein